MQAPAASVEQPEQTQTEACHDKQTISTEQTLSNDEQTSIEFKQDIMKVDEGEDYASVGDNVKVGTVQTVEELPSESEPNSPSTKDTASFISDNVVSECLGDEEHENHTTLNEEGSKLESTCREQERPAPIDMFESETQEDRSSEEDTDGGKYLAMNQYILYE